MWLILGGKRLNDPDIERELFELRKRVEIRSAPWQLASGSFVLGLSVATLLMTIVFLPSVEPIIFFIMLTVGFLGACTVFRSFRIIKTEGTLFD
jgi:hypothetical protein